MSRLFRRPGCAGLLLVPVLALAAPAAAGHHGADAPVAIVAAASPGPAAAPWTVEALMQGLARVTRAELEFRETKQSIFVITDMTTSGSMEYRAPDYLAKHTLSPFRERIVIDGDDLEVTKEVDPGRQNDHEAGQSSRVEVVRRYSVQSYPLLRSAIEGIRALLSGNFAQLADEYAMHLAGDRGAWELRLVPRSEAVLERVQEIQLTGEEFRVGTVTTVQADGDEAKLELSYLHLE